MNLGTIQDLYAHPGPFVTVHVDVSRNTEDAPQQLDARWTTLSHQLVDSGVDDAVVQRIRELVYEPTDLPGEVRRTVVATDGEIVFEDVIAGHAIWPESAHVGPLPDLSGWLHQVEGQMPFLLVVADREGAEVDFFRAMGRPDSEQSTVDGGDLHIQKVKVGGWAHKRFQQRSENQWAENAREVADEIRSAVTRHRPRLVVLAGDQRARTEILQALEGVQVEVEETEAGGRAAGSSEDSLWEAVRQILAQIEATEQQEVIARLEEAHGQGGGAALGLDDVLDALVQRKVDRLVVDLQKAHDLTVDPSKHPGLVLPAGALEHKDLPADQVLVAAGAAGDASITLVPAGMTKGNGLAALLRWTD